MNRKFIRCDASCASCSRRHTEGFFFKGTSCLLSSFKVCNASTCEASKRKQRTHQMLAESRRCHALAVASRSKNKRRKSIPCLLVDIRATGRCLVFSIIKSSDAAAAAAAACTGCGGRSASRRCSLDRCARAAVTSHRDVIKRFN
jgi:hypothetical protein